MLRAGEQGNYLKKDYSFESFPLRMEEAITSSCIKWHVVILNTFWISNELNQICSRTKNTDFYRCVSTAFKPGFSSCHVSTVKENKHVKSSIDASWCWESDSKCQISGACCVFEPSFLWLSLPEGINYGRM